MRFILQLAFRSSIRPYSSSLVRKEFVWAFKGKAYFSKVKPFSLVERIVKVWALIWDQENRNTWFLAISSTNSWGFMFLCRSATHLKREFHELMAEFKELSFSKLFLSNSFFFQMWIFSGKKEIFFLEFQMWFCFVYSKNSNFLSLPGDCLQLTIGTCVFACAVQRCNQ